jgi:lipoprotein-anchoring transpeptidase ErfK/SrfK
MRKSLFVAFAIACAALLAAGSAEARIKKFWDPAQQKYLIWDSENPHPGGPPRDPPILRSKVRYEGPYAPNTIVVDTAERRLYLVMDDGRAMKYGIGVGRDGFTWSGSDKISRKAEWPSWSPPEVMIRREAAKGRKLPTYMAGGPGNPLGARALYIGSRIYRIHGTSEPWTIGQAVSSGCIRLTNDDIIDLYDRVDVGTKVVVLN